MDYDPDVVFPRENTGRDGQVRNLYRKGKVIEQLIDENQVSVRVQELDKQGYITRLIPVKQFGSKSNQSFWCPEIGDDVSFCMLPNSTDGEGFVDGSFYNTYNPPPLSAQEEASTKHTTFGDGVVIQYRPRDSTLNIIAPTGSVADRKFKGGQTMTINISTGGAINLKGANIVITGPVTIKGDLNVDGKISNSGDMETGGKHTDSIGLHSA